MRVAYLTHWSERDRPRAGDCRNLTPPVSSESCLAGDSPLAGDTRSKLRFEPENSTESKKERDKRKWNEESGREEGK